MIAKATHAAPSIPRTLALPTKRTRTRPSGMPTAIATARKPIARPVDLATVAASICPPPATFDTTARITRPSTSSATAAPRMIWPSRVARTFSSERTRAVMPIEVAVRAAPTNVAVSVS